MRVNQEIYCHHAYGGKNNSVHDENCKEDYLKFDNSVGQKLNQCVSTKSIND